MEVPVTRSQLEALMEPLLEKCFVLAQEALTGARVASGELDRILLVGGPTQTPILRAMLSSRFGAPVDFSIDPMTVVGRGAAIYASTLERVNRQPVSPTAGQNDSYRVTLKLAYEPVSSELQCTVAGRVTSRNLNVEIKIEAEGGLWTSGWIKPDEGFFEIPVSLKEGSITTFWVYARDGLGRLLDTDTTEFRVRHGFVPSAPPLPHTLSVEVLNPGGNSVLDPVFAKGTPLPAEKKVKFRAAHPLVPDNPESDLAIKLWEGEFRDDPEANEWVGNVVLSNTVVRRSVPEGSDIDVTIKVDVSRLITVEAFVPHLNQHFSDRLYVPQREEQDFAKLSQSAASETNNYRRRLEVLEKSPAAVDDESTQSELEELRSNIDELETKAPLRGQSPERNDPDESRRIVEQSKAVRGKLSRLESRSADRGGFFKNTLFVAQVELAAEVVGKYGTTLEKQQLAMLRRELERAAAKGDDKAVQRACSEIEGLRWRVLGKQDWFWREIFDSLRQADTPFIDMAEAQKLFAKGQSAVSSGDGDILREVVRELWKIQPKDQVEMMRERALRSGLRKF
jgi:molecular chaperone DnaK